MCRSQYTPDALAPGVPGWWSAIVGGRAVRGPGGAAWHRISGSSRVATV